ncbi:MAG: Ig-like domain-containing protein [Eubacteriales bacterium]
MTDDDFTPPVAIALPMVQLSHHSVTGYVGGTLDLDYTYFNMTEPTAAWTSSDETVATVDADGIVTLIKKGEVTITLTVEGYGELKCNIIVKGKGITKR